MAPSDAAENNCNIGAQLRPITSIKVPKMFWKIYFLYDLILVRTNLFIPGSF